MPRGASARQVKKAYHEMARKWHPDKNRRPGQEKRLEKAERNFKLIARAYEVRAHGADWLGRHLAASPPLSKPQTLPLDSQVLSDKATRAAYDRGEDVDDPKFTAAEQTRSHYRSQRRS